MFCENCSYLNIVDVDDDVYIYIYAEAVESRACRCNTRVEIIHNNGKHVHLEIKTNWLGATNIREHGVTMLELRHLNGSSVAHM